VIAEAGAGASLEEIARRAGVGSATLHRHFPSRAELLKAVLRDRVQALCAQAENLLTAPSAVQAWWPGCARWWRTRPPHGGSGQP